MSPIKREPEEACLKPMRFEQEIPERVDEPEEMEVQPEEIEEEVEEDEGDDDEWEDVTMVVTVNGILDADLVRDAVERDLIKLRYAETDAPVLQVKWKYTNSKVKFYEFQINNSLYTASWEQDLGTNMVLQSKGKEMEVISCTSTMMTAEKALLTSLSTEGSTLAANAETAPKSDLSRTQPRQQ